MKEIAKTQDTYLYLDFNIKSEKLIYAWMFNDTLYGKWTSKMHIFNKYLKSIIKPEFQDKSNLLDLLNEK